MLQHVAIERIECGIVNVGRDHAFAEIIEDHDASHAAQSAKRFLVQLCPYPRAGAKHQQANRFSTVPQGQHEQPRASVLAIFRVAHHRAGAVIDLRFFAGRGLNHHTSFWRRRSAKLLDEALDALIAGSEAVAVHQVLPDRHGVATTRQSQLDRFAVGLASASRGTAAGRRRGLWRRRTRRLRAKVGGHLYGRFCRWSPSPPSRRSHRDAGRFQISGRSLPANPGGPLNAPQRPSQPPQRDDLLLLFFAQDIAHIDGG
jgi:hypothetical protein